MKKLMTVIFITLIAAHAGAVGTIVVSSGPELLDSKSGAYTLTFTCTANATIDGSFPETAFSEPNSNFFTGWHLYRIRVVPGTPAPDDDYDVTITERGGDVCGGALFDLDTAATEFRTPSVASSGSVVSVGAVTMAKAESAADRWVVGITGNSVNSAVIELTLFFTDKLFYVGSAGSGSSPAVEASTAAGQLLFGGGSGGWKHSEVGEFKWDDVAKRFGIGTADPSDKLDVFSATGVQYRGSYDLGNYFTIGAGPTGVASMVSTGNSFVFPAGSALNPGIAIGDGDSGYYEIADDTVVAIAGGLPVFQFSTATLSVNGKLLQEGIYGSIYVADGAVSQSIPTGVVYTKTTGFTTAGFASNVTMDVPNDKLTITDPGIYRVTGSVSFKSGTVKIQWYMAAFLGGVEQDECHTAQYMDTNVDFQSASFSGFVDATVAPVDIDLRVRHGAGGSINFIPDYMTLTVKYAGKT